MITRAFFEGTASVGHCLYANGVPCTIDWNFAVNEWVWGCFPPVVVGAFYEADVYQSPCQFAGENMFIEIHEEDDVVTLLEPLS